MTPFASREGMPAAAGKAPAAPDDGAAGAAGGRGRPPLARILGTLDAADESEFGLGLDRMLSGTLPALGVVFGLGVVLFSAWDYWIAPDRAGTTAMVRLSLVLLGAAAYPSWNGRLPVAWRYVLVFGTHSGAMIVSAALLPDGLVLALPAITGAMFPLALVEPRLRRLLVAVLFPTLLFLTLGAAVLPQRVYASSVLVYALALGLAGVIAIAQGRLRRTAFRDERALAYRAHHDSLTGVLARGHLIALANHDLALARRYRRPLAIAMLDIDYFKRVNDTYGHPAGDALLCAVSKVCSAQLRDSDYFGRVGGEEFVSVMPETGVAEALACAERMRKAVAGIRLETPAGTLACTISIGVAELGPYRADFDALLGAADAALYQAKSGGRDRVALAPHGDGE